MCRLGEKYKFSDYSRFKPTVFESKNKKISSNEKNIIHLSDSEESDFMQDETAVKKHKGDLKTAVKLKAKDKIMKKPQLASISKPKTERIRKKSRVSSCDIESFNATVEDDSNTNKDDKSYQFIDIDEAVDENIIVLKDFTTNNIDNSYNDVFTCESSLTKQIKTKDADKNQQNYKECKVVVEKLNLDKYSKSKFPIKLDELI